MRSELRCRARLLITFIAILGATASSLAVGMLMGTSAAGAAKAPLSISIVGNHFVNGAGHQIRLLGVNHTSAEYGCVDGFGYDDGHFDNADAAAVASWDADAVRVPLNEDCWLGINGQPNSNEGADPPLTRNGYHHEIENYVADLNRHGIYAILDLHWSAPGAQVALEQQPMADQDHSPTFWTSVASTFKNDPAVVFDLYNEPYDPTDPKSGDDRNVSDKISWNCWESGTTNGPVGGANCYTAAYDENNAETTTYRVAGLQTLLNAVRKAGAKQPVLTGGLDFANDLGDSDHGRAWMDHAPDDPLNQEAASFHNYMGKACDNATCWTNVLAPIAAHVPVVTGEFDEDNFVEAKCADKTPSTFDAKYMSWADSAGVSYLAWGWLVESPAERDADGCSAYYLIGNYTGYPPSPPNGTVLHDHLRALASPPTTGTSKSPITLMKFHASFKRGAKKVRFTLRSADTCAATITGQTVRSYGSGKHKHHPVAVGAAVRFTLKAGTSKVATLALAKRFRRLLVGRGKLKVRITITLTSVHRRRTVINHTITLKAAKRHR